MGTEIGDGSVSVMMRDVQQAIGGMCQVASCPPRHAHRSGFRRSWRLRLRARWDHVARGRGRLRMRQSARRVGPPTGSGAADRPSPCCQPARPTSGWPCGGLRLIDRRSDVLAKEIVGEIGHLFDGRWRQHTEQLYNRLDIRTHFFAFPQHRYRRVHSCFKVVVPSIFLVFIITLVSGKSECPFGEIVAK